VPTDQPVGKTVLKKSFCCISGLVNSLKVRFVTGSTAAASAAKAKPSDRAMAETPRVSDLRNDMDNPIK